MVRLKLWFEGQASSAACRFATISALPGVPPTFTAIFCGQGNSQNLRRCRMAAASPTWPRRPQPCWGGCDRVWRGLSPLIPNKQVPAGISTGMLAALNLIAAYCPLSFNVLGLAVGSGSKQQKVQHDSDLVSLCGCTKNIAPPKYFLLTPNRRGSKTPEHLLRLLPGAGPLDTLATRGGSSALPALHGVLHIELPLLRCSTSAEICLIL